MQKDCVNPLYMQSIKNSLIDIFDRFPPHSFNGSIEMVLHGYMY